MLDPLVHRIPFLPNLHPKGGASFDISRPTCRTWVDALRTLLFSLLALLTGIATAAEPAVRIAKVEPIASDVNPEARLLKNAHPARFRVTIENRTTHVQRGALAAEIVGHVDTLHGLAKQQLELAPGEKRSVPLAWTYPGPVTYDGIPSGPITVPGASWGHELNVAWLDTAGRILDRGQTVFAVDRDGQAARHVQPLAKLDFLSREQAFAMRWSGYLANPEFAEVASPEEFGLSLSQGKATAWTRGTAPSGCLAYRVRVDAAGARAATVKLKAPHIRLERALLLDLPRATRLWFQADQKQFTLELPPTGRDALLVLEFGRAYYPAPFSLAEQAARGEKQFGKFRSLLTDRTGKAITTIDNWAKHRLDLRGAIRKALGSPLQSKAVPIDPVLVSEETVPPLGHLNGAARSYVRRKVSLRISERERMNVWLLVPPGIGPFPAIVACHQTVAEGKDEPVGLGGHHYQLNYGPFLASRGFVVIAADSPGAGERLAPGEVPYDTSRMEARDPAWSMLGQRLHDHMRCIDYLQTLPFVDPARIGAIGHSLGGESTALLTAMDDRVQAAVISCPFTLMRTLGNAADTYTAKGSMILPPSFRKHLEAPVGRRQLPFDFDDCMAMWPPRPVYFHGVKDDLWANAAQVAQALQALQAVYRLHQAADRLAFHWSAQTHCFPEWVQRDAFDALDYWLKRSDRPGSTR